MLLAAEARVYPLVIVRNLTCRADGHILCPSLPPAPQRAQEDLWLPL
jgi:hypothetical protein